MQSLPIELQDEILRFCDDADLLQFRFVSRAFADASAVYVFRHISTCWLTFSLSRLSSIANSPVLVNHVRRITFYCNHMTEKKDKASFRHGLSFSYLDSSRRRRCPNDELSAEEWDVAYETYTTLCSQQADGYAAVDQGMLRDILVRFPNLEEVNISQFDVGPKYRPASSQPFNKLSLNLLRTEVMMISRNNVARDAWAIASVLDALASRDAVQTKPLLALSIETEYKYGLLRRDVDLPDIRGPALEQFLQKLRKLKMIPVWSFRNQHAMTDVQYILQHCHELRHLTLVMDRRLNVLGTSFANQAPLTGLFGSIPTPWPRLTSLRMLVNLRNRDMLTFLREHRNTLEHLSMRLSATDNLPALLDALPQAIRLASIKLLYLRSWPGESDHEAEANQWYFMDEKLDIQTNDWLLQGTEPIPDWKQMRANNVDPDRDMVYDAWRPWQMRYDPEWHSHGFPSS